MHRGSKGPFGWLTYTPRNRQAFRRAALRAACSSSRAASVPRQQVASFAVQVSKQNLPPVTSLLLSRAFSQTARFAEESSETESSEPKSYVNSEDLKKGHTVFLGNMSYDATETHIHEAFAKYGEILSISIPRDGRGSARGFVTILTGLLLSMQVDSDVLTMVLVLLTDLLLSTTPARKPLRLPLMAPTSLSGTAAASLSSPGHRQTARVRRRGTAAATGRSRSLRRTSTLATSPTRRQTAT